MKSTHARPVHSISRRRGVAFDVPDIPGGDREPSHRAAIQRRVVAVRGIADAAAARASAPAIPLHSACARPDRRHLTAGSARDIRRASPASRRPTRDIRLGVTCLAEEVRNSGRRRRNLGQPSKDDIDDMQVRVDRWRFADAAPRRWNVLGSPGGHQRSAHAFCRLDRLREALIGSGEPRACAHRSRPFSAPLPCSAHRRLRRRNRSCRPLSPRRSNRRPKSPQADDIQNLIDATQIYHGRRQAGPGMGRSAPRHSRQRDGGAAASGLPTIKLVLGLPRSPLQSMSIRCW